MLHIGTNNLVNETSKNILNGMFSLKNLIEKLCPACKVIVLNIIYRSDNGKASFNMRHVKDHMDALNLVVDNRDIGENYLNNSGLLLNSTKHGKLAINFIKKMKILSLILTDEFNFN